MLVQSVLVVLLFAELVFAGIYGTYPIANTVLRAGRINKVRWIDDNNWPSVQAMGPTRIDIYIGETYVTTVADEVDSKLFSTDVWISPSWRYNGSDYHMRFICEHPPLTIYTAEFTITGMANLVPLEGPTIDAHNMTAASVVYLTPTAASTIPSTITSMPQSTYSTVQTSATAPSISTLEEGQGPESHLQQTPNSAAATRPGSGQRPTVDLERLKFRFVFIFWPTLIGITMAI